MIKGLPITALLLLILPFWVKAQADSFRLACPLNDAVVVPPPQNVMRYDPPDLCIVLMSKPDTIVKAVINARVTNVEYDEDDKKGIVLFAKIKGKDYYFWYTGLNTTIVKRGDFVTAGQAIGYIVPGDRIEMLMYNFETPVDPSRYLDCKTVIGR